MSSADTSWIREGAEAAVCTGGTYGSVQFVPIERVTDTRVILADSRRYQRDGQRRQVDRTAGQRSGPDTALYDPQSRAVITAYARHVLREYANEVSRLVSGSAATVQIMTAIDVEAAMDDLHTKLQDARKEIDRRARSAEAAGVDLR